VFSGFYSDLLVRSKLQCMEVLFYLMNAHVIILFLWEKLVNSVLIVFQGAW
jgi:hypothetical protein